MCFALMRVEAGSYLLGQQRQYVAPNLSLFVFCASLHTRAQGLNLHVIGNIGSGASGNCSVDAVDIAIYSDSSGAPDTEQYTAKLVLPGTASGSTTLTWSTNTSAVLSLDIIAQTGTEVPAAVELPFEQTYWLRVKLLVPWGGSSGSAK